MAPSTDRDDAAPGPSAAPPPAGSDRTTPYPQVPGRADYPAMERRILQRWKERDTFQASVDARSADNEYVFYDGPPFANGLPHYGHLLTGYVKDVVPRYQTMLGKRVERRFGWDCHGLPAEMETEKQLGIGGHAAINEFGVDRFNDACRTSVLRYTAEWERYVTRQARWVDFDDDYKTMDLPYMESVMWAFAELHRRGLVYEAKRVMPYSWGAETPLSNFEIRLDDAMRPRQDPALTVEFLLAPDDAAAVAADAGLVGFGLDEAGTDIAVLAWTTTPWTLPANLALAVGPDISYDLVALDGRHYLIGGDARASYERELGAGTVVGSVSGATLVGRRYVPLFDYFADEAERGAFRVLAGEFVDTTDGTGVVHIAPGHGEDDQRLGTEAGLDMISPVDEKGRYTSEVTEWAGVNVLDANPLIVADLKDRGVVLRHETYDHNYPHCWRTDTPIIYRAVSSWFVEVTALRDRLVELNQQINWIPEHVRDGQFGQWLEGARDWSISRNRFWGTPIPVWRSDDPAFPRLDVYSSLDELEADFGVRPDNLHRPFIDELTRPNPDDPSGKATMVRVPEVFDCWFESGSMPFAQVHYPFENADWFDEHSPADFIVEYIAQTRGWFYTLHVLAGALFDRPAFSNVICHGVVLDHEGRKLSKRHRNYADPEEVMESIGSDALRWHLMSSPIIRGGDLRVSEDGKEFADVVRLILNPIWNTYSFFTTYANIDGYRATFRTDATGPLDRYLLAKTAQLRDAMGAAMDAYDIPGACNQVASYLDALTNWYVRRSRDRFWAPADRGASGELAPDKADAYDTLYTALTTLCRLVAPLLPLVAEEVYCGLSGEESVHLTDWPGEGALPADEALTEAMDRVRAVASATLSLREEHRLRTRLPLNDLVVAGADAHSLEPFVDLIADEVNVRSVRLEADASAYATAVLRPNARLLGPRLGKEVQAVLAAARTGQWVETGDGGIEVAGQRLTAEEYELAMSPVGPAGDASDDGGSPARGTEAVTMIDPEGRSLNLGLVVSLDLEVTEELADEGRARDVIRLIQQARKHADLAITDRIRVTLGTDDQVLRHAITTHRAHIASQTLADAIDVVAGGDGSDELPTAAVGDVDGRRLALHVESLVQ
ncbi:MAG: isoleucine--tRNA ligase [Microthrixaceae bacterium]